jgi:hypothetical protein
MSGTRLIPRQPDNAAHSPPSRNLRDEGISSYDAQAHPVPGGPNKMGNEGASSSAVVCTDGKNAERDRPVTNRCPNDKTKPISAVGV